MIYSSVVVVISKKVIYHFVVYLLIRSDTKVSAWNKFEISQEILKILLFEIFSFSLDYEI